MRRRAIIGTSVSITDYDEVVEVVSDAVEGNRQIFICCAPASSLIFARDDTQLARAFAAADVVTPDGMGVVHAARLLGEHLDDRVYGPDLMALTLEQVDATHFLYGGYDDAALALLRRSLAERFPAAKVVDAHSPPHRELDAAEIGVDGLLAKNVLAGVGAGQTEIGVSVGGRADQQALDIVIVQQVGHVVGDLGYPVALGAGPGRVQIQVGDGHQLAYLALE